MIAALLKRPDLAKLNLCQDWCPGLSRLSSQGLILVAKIDHYARWHVSASMPTLTLVTAKHGLTRQESFEIQTSNLDSIIYVLRESV